MTNMKKINEIRLEKVAGGLGEALEARIRKPRLEARPPRLEARPLEMRPGIELEGEAAMTDGLADGLRWPNVIKNNLEMTEANGHRIHI